MENEKIKLYIEFSKDIEEALLSNGGIQHCLKEAFKYDNIEAQIAEDEARYQNENGVRDKDIVTTVLITTTALTALSISISNLITSIKGVSTFVVYNELEPIRNADGNILLDKEKNPIMQKTKKIVKKDPKKNYNEKYIKLSFNIKNGLVLEFKNIEKDN